MNLSRIRAEGIADERPSSRSFFGAFPWSRQPNVTSDSDVENMPSSVSSRPVDKPQSTDEKVASNAPLFVSKMSSRKTDDVRYQKRTSETGVDGTDCHYVSTSAGNAGVTSMAKSEQAMKRRRSVESTCSDGTVATTSSTVFTSQFSDSLNRSFRRASSLLSTDLDTSYSTRASLNDTSSCLARSCSDASDSTLLNNFGQLNCQADSREKSTEGKEGHVVLFSSQLESNILKEPPFKRSSGDWKFPGELLGPADLSTFDDCASDDGSSVVVDIPLELSKQVDGKRRSSLRTIKSGEEGRQSFVTIKSIEFSLGDISLGSLEWFDDLVDV